MKVSVLIITQSDFLKTLVDEDDQPTEGHVELEISLPFPSSTLMELEEALDEVRLGVTEKMFFKKDDNVANLSKLLEAASFLQVKRLTLFLVQGLNHLCKHYDYRLAALTKKSQRINPYWIGDQSLLNIAAKVWLLLAKPPINIKNMDDSCFSSRSMIRRCRISLIKYWRDVVAHTNDDYLLLLIEDCMNTPWWHHNEEAMNICVSTGKLETMKRIYTTSEYKPLKIMPDYLDKAKSAGFTHVLEWIKQHEWRNECSYISYWTILRKYKQEPSSLESSDRITHFVQEERKILVDLRNRLF